MTEWKRGPIVRVATTDDGTPICPHCGQPTVTDDGGKTWDSPDWVALRPGIERDLIAAMNRLSAQPMQPRERLLSPRCGLHGQHRRCHSAICECDCHYVTKESA